MSDRRNDSKRIAKNTVLLYMRMLFLMVIGLYTSRVILQTLGVEDFGIYNVVGGFVTLFAVVSQSLSSASSRFFTFALGQGENSELNKVFSSILIIHVLLAIIIIVLAEIIGGWFVNNKMVLPEERLDSANWAFQFSVLSFCITIISVPYNAAIIAHEKMNAFAFISIFEGVAKLLICYLLIISPIDKLIFYAILLFGVNCISRCLFYIYCRRHFVECRFHFIRDKNLLKELFGFAGWNFIGSTAAILRDQGGNILVNLFGGPVVNAARAVANQVLHVVQGFVESFMTAIRPQITKSYSCGDNEYMTSLIFYGSRFSFYMLLILSLPILVNTEYLLDLWLKTVPEHSILFVRLTLVFILIESLSYTLITAQQATGDIKNYQIIVGGISLLNVPISYVLLKLGSVPETIMYVAIFFSVCSLFARLLILKGNEIRLDLWLFSKKVLLNVLLVSVISSIPPIIAKNYLHDGFVHFTIISTICVLSTSTSILFIGFNDKERQMTLSKVKQLKFQIIKWSK